MVIGLCSPETREVPTALRHRRHSGELKLYEHHVVTKAHREVEGGLAGEEVCHLRAQLVA